MFHSFIAAITSFFLSFVQQPAQPQNQTTTPPVTHNQQIKESKSYYYFDNEERVRVHLYVGDNSGIISANAQKRFFIQGDITFQGCLIESIEPDIRAKIEVTDQSYLDFGVKLVAPCKSSNMVFTGEKIIQNVVTINGKSYTTAKSISFGPVTIPNKALDSEVFIQLIAKGNIVTLQSQQVKSLIFKLIDKNGAQIDPQKIESITVRTLDSSKLKFIDKDGNIKAVLQIVQPNDSSGIIQLKSMGKAGTAGIEITAKIRGVKTTFTIKKEFSVVVEKSPIVDVKVVLQPQQKTVVINNVYYINYNFKNGDEFLNDDEINKVEIAVDNAMIIYNDQELKKLILNNAKSSGIFYIKPLIAGEDVKISLNLYLNNGKIIKKEDFLAVVAEPLIHISINPTKTEYDPALNMYKSQFVVHVLGGKPYERYNVDVITPKILYPHAYYNGFISGSLDYENKNVYYNGIQKGSYSGKIEQNEVAMFSSTFYDLNQVVIGNDKLIILPNKFVTDKTLIGNWDIVSIKENKLILSEKTEKSQDNLSFVIGSEVRYDPIHYTLATMTLDSLDHIYILDENGSFTFTVTYPPFMMGKDVFVGIHQVDNDKRVGNSLKFTLQGTGLSYTKEFKCADKSVCVWRITIKQKDSSERLTYSRLERNCQGTKGAYKLLTSYKLKNGGCGSYLNEKELKTDDKGYVYLCIFPNVKYKEVESDETSGGNTLKVPDGYEEATVSCEFELDEEFPY